MTIEVSLVIAAISLAFGIYQGISNMKRNNKSDTANDTAQLTTVIVKLENISKDTGEIKTDIRGVKADLRNLSDRLIKCEQQIKVLNNAVFNNRKEDENES